MKKTISTKPSFETRLPNDLIKAWHNTLLATARIKGIEKKSSDDEKLSHIIRGEQNNVKKLEAFTTERENLPRYLLDPKSKLLHTY